MIGSSASFGVNTLVAPAVLVNWPFLNVLLCGRLPPINSNHTLVHQIFHNGDINK